MPSQHRSMAMPNKTALAFLLLPALATATLPASQDDRTPCCGPIEFLPPAQAAWT
ncbi:hypothetical protein IWX65_002248 [Arthrobacter sp. CAN_A214]